MRAWAIAALALLTTGAEAPTPEKFAAATKLCEQAVKYAESHEPLAKRIEIRFDSGELITCRSNP